LSNLSSTAMLVAANPQMPLYYYGRIILENELKNIETRRGNDLAIPEYATLVASIGEIAGKLGALESLKLEPVVISEVAGKSRPTLRRSFVAALGAVVGAIFGFLYGLYQLLKTRPGAGTRPGPNPIVPDAAA